MCCAEGENLKGQVNWIFKWRESVTRETHIHTNLEQCKLNRWVPGKYLSLSLFRPQCDDNDAYWILCFACVPCHLHPDSEHAWMGMEAAVRHFFSGTYIHHYQRIKYLKRRKKRNKREGRINRKKNKKGEQGEKQKENLEIGISFKQNIQYSLLSLIFSVSLTLIKVASISNPRICSIFKKTY